MAGKKLGDVYRETGTDNFPEQMTITIGHEKTTYRKREWKTEGEKEGLRYGDNPGQEAALYEPVNGRFNGYAGTGDGIISSLTENDCLETGKHLSKSNFTDLDSALNILKYFDEPTVVIMKHNNPSGVASRNSVKEAYVAANDTDRIAAYGGVVAANAGIDAGTASEICRNFVEVVAAPSFGKAAKDMLAQKKNMRLLTIQEISKLADYRKKRYLEFKALLDGGIIVQQSADNELSAKNLMDAEAEYKKKAYAVKRKPTAGEIDDMLFSWKVVQGVISNSMVFVKGKTTVAIGTGEQDRVGATELAIAKAYKKAADRVCFQMYGIPLWEMKENEKIAAIEKEVEATKAGLKGSVLASDGFLPLRDTVDVAAKVGVTAIIQPGGSARDYQSIEACNEHGIAMAFTGKRVFRH